MGRFGNLTSSEARLVSISSCRFSIISIIPCEIFRKLLPQFNRFYAPITLRNPNAAPLRSPVFNKSFQYWDISHSQQFFHQKLSLGHVTFPSRNSFSPQSGRPGSVCRRLLHISIDTEPGREIWSMGVIFNIEMSMTQFLHFFVDILIIRQADTVFSLEISY